MHTTPTRERQRALESWLRDVLPARGVAADVAVEPLAGDASFRRFYRVAAGSAPMIAMDAPPATENNAQFVRLADFFAAAGVRVPRVLAHDLAQGFLLVEDLGRVHYAEVYATPQHDAVIEAALETLLAIRSARDPQGVVPPYTRARLHDELELFRVWLAEGFAHLELTDSERREMQRIWTALVDNSDGQAKVCVHRDYHSRNLLWCPGGVTGVVDFQDALWGPELYDLASLLRDCYVRFDEVEIERWRNHFAALAKARGMPLECTDPERLATVFDLTACQRQLKALGIFARLELRDGRPSHLVDIAPVLDRLIETLRSQRGYGGFADWLAGRVRPPVHVSLRARGIACAQ
jgi:aminoglycoside/choline kinase family phosphotransferase